MPRNSAETLPECSITLPTEIILPIFEQAARASRENARNLCLVASWTLPIMRLVLYESCYISSSKGLNSFCVALGLPYHARFEDQVLSLFRSGSASSKRSQNRERKVDVETMKNSKFISAASADVGRMVRHLFVPAQLKYLAKEQFESVLKKCPNLVDLATPSTMMDGMQRALVREVQRHSAAGDPNSSEAPTTGIPPHITRLTLLSETLRYDWDLLSSVQHFLQNLTHICFTEQEHSAYLPIRQLTNLTHLALPLPSRSLYAPGDAAKSAKAEAVMIMMFKGHSKLEMLVLHTELHGLYSAWSRRSRGLLGSLCNRTFLEVLRAVNSVAHRNTNVRFLPIGPSQRMEKHKLWGALWEDSTRGNPDIWDMAAELHLRAHSGEYRLDEWFPIDALVPWANSWRPQNLMIERPISRMKIL